VNQTEIVPVHEVGRDPEWIAPRVAFQFSDMIVWAYGRVGV